ncbi:NAD(P)-dependent glycerol-3-phosphate dehydrogenase [bacterium]|nr:NAD(P)-dependent glycerol-3-phosphate dehydrogenase [bacterium]
MREVSVLGAGSFGTTLAVLLDCAGVSSSLFCRSQETADEINTSRTNSAYFPGRTLPERLHATSSLSEALEHSKTVYLAVPCKYLRSFLNENEALFKTWVSTDRAADLVLCNCTKGLLLDPTQRSGEFLQQWFAADSVTASTPALVHLSGPNLASEIMAGFPAAAVAAASQQQQWAAQRIQDQLMSSRFRVYAGSDPVGVEVAGFYKNVLAIAAGALSGLELGSNSLAALITRGLAEMGRAVRHFGGDPATLLGLAGVGDLVATCSSSLSRNFQVGYRRARGESTEEILAAMQQVAEGVQTCRALHDWMAAPLAGGAPWPELPIALEVHRILFEGLSPADSIRALMLRPPRTESV